MAPLVCPRHVPNLQQGFIKSDEDGHENVNPLLMASSSLYQIVHHIASDQFIALVGREEFFVESSGLDNKLDYVLCRELLEA